MDWHLDFTVIIFVATYIGVAAGRVGGLQLDRTGFALIGALLLLLSGSITLEDAVRGIDFPTILTLLGLMILSGYLQIAGFYTVVAQKLTVQLARPTRFLWLLMLASGGFSALLLNDVVCLALTPLITPALLRNGLNPVPYLVGLALAANIGSAATTIGNPQNILVAQSLGLSFGPFLLWTIVPVLLALHLAFGIVWLLSRRKLRLASTKVSAAQPADMPKPSKPQIIKGLIATVIMVGLFFSPLPHELAALAAAGIVLFSRKVPSRDLLARVDWSLIVLFCSLFVVVSALSNTGLPKEAVSAMNANGIELESPYTLSLVAVVLGNLISNVPAVMLLLQLEPITSTTTGYALAVASTFSGNLILMGSIANLIVAEQAKRCGLELGFREFARYGIVTTVLSILLLMGWIALMS